MQFFSRAPDVEFRQHRLEQHQEIEVGAGEIYFIQHIAEVKSFDAASSSCHPRFTEDDHENHCNCSACFRLDRRDR